MMHRLEEPGVRRNAPDLRGATEMARSNPGQWVFVKEYDSQNSASSACWQWKKNIAGIETCTRGPRAYLRVMGVETKNA